MTGPGRVPAILAIGLCCPLGHSFAEAGTRYAAGDRAFRKERALVGADGFPPTLAQAVPLPDCRDYGPRLKALFDAALADCVGQSSPPPGGWALRLVVDPGVHDQPGAESLRADLLRRHAGVLRSVALVRGGPAEALSELGHAAKAVLDGDADLVLIGALDSLIHPLILDHLAWFGRLLMRGNPWGIIPGEAAALMLVGLAGAERAALGHVMVVARGQEAEDVSAPKGIVGRGLAQAFTEVARFAAPDRLLVDLDGERWRAEEFGFAVSRAAAAGGGRIAALAADPEAAALHLGHCGAATGMILPALALLDPPRRAPAGPVTLVSAASRDGGARAAALIERA